MKVIKEGTLKEMTVICNNCRSELLITKLDLLKVEREYFGVARVELEDRYLKCPICKEIAKVRKNIVDYLEEK